MEPTWSVREAFVGLLVAAIRADGRERAPEHDAAEAYLETRFGLDGLAFARLAEDMAARLRRMGERAYLAECARALAPAEREAALVAAAGVVVADRDVPRAEADFLARAAAALGIPRETLDRRMPAGPGTT